MRSTPSSRSDGVLSAAAGQEAIPFQTIPHLLQIPTPGSTASPTSPPRDEKRWCFPPFPTICSLVQPVGKSARPTLRRAPGAQDDGWALRASPSRVHVCMLPHVQPRTLPATTLRLADPAQPGLGSRGKGPLIPTEREASPGTSGFQKGALTVSALPTSKNWDRNSKCR